MRSYYTSGVLNEEGYWLEGKANGPAVGYFPTGQLAEYGQYKLGKKVGSWFRLLEEGGLAAFTKFDSSGENGAACERLAEGGGVECGGVIQDGRVGEWVRFQLMPPHLSFQTAPKKPQHKGIPAPRLESTRGPR